MIDHIQKVLLGGFPQKIHIRFKNPDAPILLVLHGGPGISNRHTMMTAHADLARDFVLVCWDQRGCAGSYAGVDKKTLTVKQLCDDACELAEWLCDQFGQPQLSLLCGSWGTQLGTLLAFRHPKRIASYVGMGQAVDGVANELLSWQFTLEQALAAGDSQAQAELAEIGPPTHGQYKGGIRGLLTQRRLLAHFGGSARKSEGFINAYLRPVILSGEYTPADIWGYLRGYRLVLETMWPTLVSYDFRKQENSFAMPYYIFQGRHDYNTPSTLVEEYYTALTAPKKELIWFEESAHSPLRDEPERFKRLLRERLLAGSIIKES